MLIKISNSDETIYVSLLAFICFNIKVLFSKTKNLIKGNKGKNQVSFGYIQKLNYCYFATVFDIDKTL